jgi:phosphoesterase RecJ-like protein
MATSLLTGIISKTKGFQTHTVTPRSLAVASHLITAGARREVIVRNLYQTKSLAALRLWGRALTKIESVDNGRLVWTSVTRDDLRQSGAAVSDAVGALDELIVNTPVAEVAALFIEQNGTTEVHVMTTNHHPLPALPPELVPQTPAYYTGSLPGNIKTVSAKVIGLINPQTPG